jgi:hypothetical protein
VSLLPGSIEIGWAERGQRWYATVDISRAGSAVRCDGNAELPAMDTLSDNGCTGG